MQQSDKPVLAIVRASYDRMTPIEQSIADFFLGEPPPTELSAKTVTAKLFISKASLSRFANRCGYEGYREFVFKYKEDMLDNRNSPSFTEMTQKVIETYQTIFDRTLALIDEKQLQRIASLLIESQRVYLYGNGSSGLAAREFRLRFMRLGMPVEAIDDYLLMKINSAVVQPNTLVIGMSISGTTRSLMSSLRLAKEHGARVLLMTANNSQRLVREFDEVLHIASDTMLDAGLSVSPQFPLLIMGDILFSYYINTDLLNLRAIHQETHEALKRNIT